VADLMCGVGPFAVPLALRGASVLANDLNPDSYAWLAHNTALNRVGALVKHHCMDARRFVAVLRGRAPVPPLSAAAVAAAEAAAASGASTAANTAATKTPPSSSPASREGADEVWLEPVWFDHAIMDLPQIAIEFLHAFRGYLYTRPKGTRSSAAATSGAGSAEGASDLDGLELLEVSEGVQGESEGSEGGKPVRRRLPMIHVYCFEKEVEGDDDAAPRAAVARCVAALGGSTAPASLLPRDQVDVHVVRYVSPQKPMLCLSFRLPLAVALAPPLRL
jgi:tRNA (guanine37-N1)-methyltransferase